MGARKEESNWHFPPSLLQCVTITVRNTVTDALVTSIIDYGNVLAQHGVVLENVMKIADHSQCCSLFTNRLL